jgi:hypothetical protein
MLDSMMVTDQDLSAIKVLFASGYLNSDRSHLFKLFKRLAFTRLPSIDGLWLWWAGG